MLQQVNEDLTATLRTILWKDFLPLLIVASTSLNSTELDWRFNINDSEMLIKFSIWGRLKSLQLIPYWHWSMDHSWFVNSILIRKLLYCMRFKYTVSFIQSLEITSITHTHTSIDKTKPWPTVSFPFLITLSIFMTQ